MRLSRLTLLAVPAALALAACNSDDVTAETRPPLAGVRYINAVPDTSRLDFRMVDQLESGEIEKLVLTQRNRLRAVVLSAEAFSEIQQRLDRQVLADEAAPPLPASPRRESATSA